MESTDPRELARTLERAEAAPYLDYPELPGWYPVAFAAWFAAMAAVVGYVGNLWVIAALFGLIVVEVLFVRWFVRAHGAMPWPGKGNPPAEIARLYRAYYVAAAGVVVAVGLIWWLVGHWPAVAATFVLASLGFWLYDVRYEVAAARVRERLA